MIANVLNNIVYNNVIFNLIKIIYVKLVYHISFYGCKIVKRGFCKGIGYQLSVMIDFTEIKNYLL